MEIAPTFPIFPAKVQSLTKLMPHFTTADLERLGYVQQSNGSYRHPNHEPKSQATHQPCAARLPDTKCKQVRPKTLERVSQAQDRSQNSTPCSNAGRRSHVTIVRHSSRLLDPDNLVASVKPLIDEIRKANLIADDDPASIKLTVLQSQCRRGDERTELEIKSCE
jgi:hypothetical protein